LAVFALQMNPRVLIDALVRQTTVLIASISTAEGFRSPLGHIANEVFSGLVAELENQGHSNKVIADMFGMALRSYRQKVQRLGESATTRGVTLWSAVQRFLSERGSASRREVVKNFRHDEEASIRGILSDLVESGLVLRSGRGEDTHYRVATDEELRDLGTFAESRPEESNAAVVWVHIYREGPLSRERLAELVPLPESALDTALELLIADGRVRRERSGKDERFLTEEVLIPVGEAAGWEAAIIDHHRALVNAIAAKVKAGARGSSATDEVGGTTLTFDLWPGHPHEREVRDLLRSTRAQVLSLWDSVMEYNRLNPRPDAYQLSFYCGQYLVREDDPV
jgi:hypothetical protein